MDIATFFDIGKYRSDFTVGGGALVSEPDLNTAVIISLFTDRRAEPDDELPNPTGSRRGWWGDALAERRIGSRLWLLSREKQLREVLNRAKEYAAEALAWMVEDGVAQQVTVDAQIVSTGLLGLSVQIDRNNAQPAVFRYELAWNQLRS